MICKNCGCSTRMSVKAYQTYDPETEFVYCNKCYKAVKKEATQLVLEFV